MVNPTLVGSLKESAVVWGGVGGRLGRLSGAACSCPDTFALGVDLACQACAAWLVILNNTIVSVSKLMVYEGKVVFCSVAWMRSVIESWRLLETLIE